MFKLTINEEQQMIRAAMATARQYVGPDAVDHAFDDEDVFEFVASACLDHARSSLGRVRVTTADVAEAARLALEMADAGL